MVEDVLSTVSYVMIARLYSISPPSAGEYFNAGCLVILSSSLCAMTVGIQVPRLQISELIPVECIEEGWSTTEPQSRAPSFASFNLRRINNFPTSSLVTSDTVRSIERQSRSTNTASSSGNSSTTNSFQFNNAVALPVGLSSVNLTRVTNPSSDSTTLLSVSIRYCILRPLNNLTCKNSGSYVPVPTC
ncbi:hypothetical protein F3Y22_tig00116958pilonHSYRG00302 [Hibiscus syriacus]|uniref:Uncharacterized protein n=1 Tax=Hibiscus syriacus TaxID=106335 RepID=A0A6A2WM25_HIBSY|nr:hypothetical protein F3Y22_tig00116958pilonHSYRG00302 [Hibiscus syriacus]